MQQNAQDSAIQATLRELEVLARFLEDRDAEQDEFLEEFDMELADSCFDWDAMWDSSKLRWMEGPPPTLHL